MQSLQALAQPAIPNAIVIDLIGDLDATLGAIFSDALGRIAGDSRCRIFVSTKHVADTTREGLERMDAAISTARSHGSAIVLEAGNRRMKNAFRFARIACEAVPRPTSRRHMMLAHRSMKNA